jgi:hypothetical protein
MLKNILKNDFLRIKNNRKMTTPTATLSLDEQRIAFSKRKFIAMPIAGTIVWLLIGIAGMTLEPTKMVWVCFLGTGSIAYLGMFISKFTGENFIDKSRPKNTFDTLFMMTVAMAWLVFSIAMPFASLDYTSIPLSLGILAGLMWLPFSWIIEHWVGIFHTIVRTVSVLALWYLFPEKRFVFIPFAIVFIYLITIYVLLNRKRNV